MNGAGVQLVSRRSIASDESERRLSWVPAGDLTPRIAFLQCRITGNFGQLRNVCLLLLFISEH